MEARKVQIVSQASLANGVPLGARVVPDHRGRVRDALALVRRISHADDLRRRGSVPPRTRPGLELGLGDSGESEAREGVVGVVELERAAVADRVPRVLDARENEDSSEAVGPDGELVEVDLRAALLLANLRRYFSSPGSRSQTKDLETYVGRQDELAVVPTALLERERGGLRRFFHERNLGELELGLARRGPPAPVQHRQRNAEGERNCDQVHGRELPPEGVRSLVLAPLRVRLAPARVRVDRQERLRIGFVLSLHRWAGDVSGASQSGRYGQKRDA